MRHRGTDTSSIGRRRAIAKADGGPAYQARREEIIDAAGRVFLAKGYRATSFRDIANEVGLDRASLYYYFASKQELFQTATGAAVARNVRAAERIARSEAPPDQKIAEVIGLLLDSYMNGDYPFMFIFLQEDVNRINQNTDDAWAHTVRSLTRRYEAAVTGIVEEGMAAGVFADDAPPHLITKALLGMANWTHRWYRTDGPLEPDEIAGIFSRLLLRGICR